MLLKKFYLISIMVFCGGVRTEVTFKDVSLSTFYDPLGKIDSSKTLKEHLPSSFTHSVIVTGEIKILYENSVADIDSVQELYFQRNGLEEIEPGAFRNLTSVTCLVISHSKLKSIKEGVFDKLNLRELQVSFNPVSSISKKVFGVLPQLLSLSLANNHIEMIEDGAFDHLTTLQIVDLSNNRLVTLPRNLFKNLINLQMLMIRNNKLEVLNFGSLSTDHLDLSNNSISSLPENLFDNFPNLTRIILSFNKLTEIPKGIFTNQLLQQVEITNNEITYVDTDAFDNMPNLANLLLSNNKLTTYNPRWFFNTPNIYRLFLSGNLIEDLPNEAFLNIYNEKKQWIKLDNNKIRRLPVDAFKGFRRINNLNLADNQISFWTDKLLRDVKVIDSLNLLNNEIRCPDGDFGGVFKANITYMSGNPLTVECLDKIEQWQKENPRKTVCTASIYC